MSRARNLRRRRRPAPAYEGPAWVAPGMGSVDGFFSSFKKAVQRVGRAAAPALKSVVGAVPVVGGVASKVIDAADAAKARREIDKAKTTADAARRAVEDMRSQGQQPAATAATAATAAPVARSSAPPARSQFPIVPMILVAGVFIALTLKNWKKK